MNITTNAKGLAQRDITVEANSLEEATRLFKEANTAWKEAVVELGIREANG